MTQMGYKGQIGFFLITLFFWLWTTIGNLTTTPICLLMHTHTHTVKDLEALGDRMALFMCDEAEILDVRMFVLVTLYLCLPL